MVHPARHQRLPDNPKSKPSGGLLSHVFSFVSREFESFVLNATARPANQPVSTGRVKGSRRGRNRSFETNMSEDETRYNARFQHPQQGHEKLYKPGPSRRKPHSQSTDSTRKYRRDHLRATYVTDDDDDDRVLSASDPDHSKSSMPPSSIFPVPPLPKLKKQSSFTMPGSLFPRSPSLVPEQTDQHQHMQPPSEAPAFIQPLQPFHAESGPSRNYSFVPSTDVIDPNQPFLDQYVSPWRTRSVASVKDAVQRFNVTEGAESDFSLMLPSPHSSPVSKARFAYEPSSHRSASDSTLSMASTKGKERTRDGMDDTDLDFIVRGGSESTGVHAKERELDAAREEQREHERLLSGNQSRRASGERERDKQRIKALEEEVRQLKEELSRSQVRSSPPPSFSPPTPPPPPPPPPPPLPLRIDTTPCTPTSMFATARASLRHAMTPVEVPINNPGLNRTKRHGQPTVNVPSEKMAAFLHEIKTAKLKRVGSGVNAMGGDGVAGPSGLSKSVNMTADPRPADLAKLSAQELQRRRSLASLRVPIGSSQAAPMSLMSTLATAKESQFRASQKRKADTLDANEATGTRTKRRMTEFSSGTSQLTAISSLKVSLGSNLSLPLRLPPNETDVTTPSLCSDNDRDETSIEDRIPSTPPGPRANTAIQKTSGEDAQEQQIEVIDVDMERRSHSAQQPISSDALPGRTSELFKKRPPTSPFPIPTPRRPSAPARTKRGATPRPKSLLPTESDVDDEDKPFSQPAPVPFLSLIPVPKYKPTKPKAKHTLAGNGHPRASPRQHNTRPCLSNSGSSSQKKRKKTHRRRQTLDEELRTAVARSSDTSACNDECPPELRDDDVFTATGMKSKRKGFLAHGGGGGTPVFIDVGYGKGVTLGSEDEDRFAGGPPSKTIQTRFSHSATESLVSS